MPSCLRLCFVLAIAAPLFSQAVNYDIVYVRAPRFGDNTSTRWPEVFDPMSLEPGADLMLLHPNGQEEVLFAGGNGAVVDPAVSFDAQWVFFSYFPDMRTAALNYQRRYAPTGGADIYKIHLATRQVVRLTQQVWTPPSGAANWSSNHLSATPAGTYYLGYGIFNLGPMPLPGGKLMFTSSRDGYVPNKDYTFPNLRLYVMDQDGKNVEKIGHINIGSALHPTVLKDGRVMFSSYEAQGIRDQRMWGLWAIWPDGRKWEPLFSAFTDAAAMHFQTQLSDGRLAVIEYYNLNNNGFGTLLGFNSVKQPGMAPFGSPVAGNSSNPAVRRGLWFFDPSHPAHLQPRYKQYPFSPSGLFALSGFTHGEDEASSRALDGTWAGKVTHPAGAPNNDVLLVWSPGPANDLNRPTTIPVYDGGIYVLRSGVATNDHRQLVLVKNSPLFNEQQPRPVVPYSAIYGIPEPATIPFLPNDGSDHPTLAAGTPFGLVGTSSFYKRNTAPGAGVAKFGGLDPFNTNQNGASSNWFQQGADAGKYTNADIHAVRIVALEGVAHRSYGPVSNVLGFRNHADRERLRIMGEIPLRKTDGAGNSLIDGDGNPDTSFLARIPADTPFTFQTLDKDGLVLNMAQTWHQVRPGEARTDCGGCHAHAQVGTEFSTTAASRGGYQIADLINKTPILTKDTAGKTAVRELNQRTVDIEYYRDIKPLLQRSCVPCHSKSGTAEAGLVLDDTAVVNGYENTYHRLANDTNAQYGIKPVISSGTWRESNASRYIRMFQSRRSLLTWKVFGRRLDGWTNADFPTESTPGNAATLPAGANANEADIDYTGTIMPPPGSGIPALSEDEKMTIARWIDLGCPISSQDPAIQASGWFADELRPTLTVSSPRAGVNPQSLQSIRIGAYDSYSGIDRASLSVVANFAVNGKAAGTELRTDFAETGDHLWSLNLLQPISNLTGTLTVRMKDLKGNWSTVVRDFSVGTGGPPPPTGTQVTVTTIPTGIPIQVDGAALTSPQTFQWTPGSVHVINALDVAGASTRQQFRNWSDGGPRSHSITTPSSTVTFAATYATQHLLTRQVSPANGGALAVAPASNDNFYDQGTSVQLTAAPAGGFTFAGFQGSLSGTANPQTLVMSAPRSVTAAFNAVVVVDTQAPTVSLTAPAGASVSGTITVSANASDNTGVVGVQFRLVGANLGAEDPSSPYSTSWNTTTVGNGSYTLTAVARDAAGNLGTSSPITVTVNNVTTPPPPPTSALRAAYAFDEAASSVPDLSGNGHNGTISGATWTAAGRYCGALSFDGVNDWVTIADSALLDLTTGMTISAWVKPSSLQGWTTVVLKERPGGLAYALYASDDTNRPPAGYARISNNDQSAKSGAALQVNAWSHLAVTYDGATLRFYVNGALVESRSVPGSILTSAGALRIGGNSIWGEYFKGLIDEMRVYGRALSAEEIRGDINRPVSTSCAAAADTTRPTVSITGPAAGAPVRGIVTIKTVSQDGVALREVQFFVDGSPLSTDRYTPYTATWNASNATPGTHRITATAIDAAGNTGSAEITVSR